MFSMFIQNDALSCRFSIKASQFLSYIHFEVVIVELIFQLTKSFSISEKRREENYFFQLFQNKYCFICSPGTHPLFKIRVEQNPAQTII